MNLDAMMLYLIVDTQKLYLVDFSVLLNFCSLGNL